MAATNLKKEHGVAEMQNTRQISKTTHKEDNVNYL